METALDDLKGLYTKSSAPTPTAIITGILCYILLLFPYFIQRRNTKNIYRLFGQEGGRKNRNSEGDYLGYHQTKEESPKHTIKEKEDNSDSEYITPQNNQLRRSGGLHGRIRIE